MSFYDKLFGLSLQARRHARSVRRLGHDTQANRIETECTLGASCEALEAIWHNKGRTPKVSTSNYVLGHYKVIKDTVPPYPGQTPVIIPFDIDCIVLKIMAEDLLKVEKFGVWISVVPPTQPVNSQSN